MAPWRTYVADVMVAVGDLTVLVVDVDDVPEVMVKVADDDLDDVAAADDAVALTGATGSAPEAG